MCLKGWNMMEVISALLFPLFNSWTRSPPSEEKILIMCPRLDADAISVPSELTAMAPISVLSWASIYRSIDLSTTKFNTLRCPFSVAGRQMILLYGFSAWDKATSPRGFWNVSTYSINFNDKKLKMKAFSANTTTIISFLNLTLLISWFLLNVISVRFFFS